MIERLEHGLFFFFFFFFLPLFKGFVHLASFKTTQSAFYFNPTSELAWPDGGEHRIRLQTRLALDDTRPCFPFSVRKLRLNRGKNEFFFLKTSAYSAPSPNRLFFLLSACDIITISNLGSRVGGPGGGGGGTNLRESIHNIDPVVECKYRQY